MSDEKKGANSSEPPPENINATPPGEGKSRDTKTVDQLLSEYKAENQRKSEENKSLKSEISSMKERLEELEEKQNLTKSEKKEVKELETDLENAVKELYSRKDTQAWIRIAQKEAAEAGHKISLETVMDMEITLGNEFIEDEAEKLGITPKELALKIAPYALKFNDKRPARRNELSFRAWQKEDAKRKELDEREAKIKKEETDRIAFREGSGRGSRGGGSQTKFEEAKTAEDRLSSVVDLIDSVKPLR